MQVLDDGFPLISAVQEGNVSEVKRRLALLHLASDFLPPSSSPLLACDQGLNVLHMTVRYNRVKSAEMILAFAGSQDKQLCTGLVNMPNGIDGSTPLLMAIAHVPCHTVGPIKMVRLLLDHSAETDTMHTYNHGGMTPLLQAVLLDLPSVIEDLLVASNRASAPLLASVSFLLTQVVHPTPPAGNGDLFDRLQRHPLQGFNALHIACRDGKVDCARVLLAHSSPEYALVRTATTAGQTPIQLAAQCGHAPIVELLWQHTNQGILGDDCRFQQLRAEGNEG
jgi:ankyrin repeat protein